MPRESSHGSTAIEELLQDTLIKVMFAAAELELVFGMVLLVSSSQQFDTSCWVVNGYDWTCLNVASCGGVVTN